MFFQSRLRLLSVAIAALGILYSSSCTAQEGMSRKDVINSLEAGVQALRVIDKPEEAERLLRILRDYAGPRRDREMTEREVRIQHVKHMRIALNALVRTGKERQAHQLEQAIRARELRLEGRDDPEAREMIADSPSRGAQIELLGLAGRILKEEGNHEAASVVLELANRFRRPGDRRPENAERRARERETDANRREEARRHAVAEERRVKERAQRGGKREAGAQRARIVREAPNSDMRRLSQRLDRHDQMLDEISQRLRRISGALERLSRESNRDGRDRR